MSSVREFASWQDAYIFCLQPNFQDDLRLFMILASLQVFLTVLKLGSFIILRWAKNKTDEGGNGDERCAENGPSRGIKIIGVLTLIAGKFQEKTPVFNQNISKAH